MPALKSFGMHNTFTPLRRRLENGTEVMQSRQTEANVSDFMPPSTSATNCTATTKSRSLGQPLSYPPGIISGMLNNIDNNEAANAGEMDGAKLRADSNWSGLTGEQRQTLERWLFEENLSYKETLERARKEFGIEASLASLQRFRRRVIKERTLAAMSEAEESARRSTEPKRAWHDCAHQLGRWWANNSWKKQWKVVTSRSCGHWGD